jgi:hypothetical protein
MLLGKWPISGTRRCCENNFMMNLEEVEKQVLRNRKQLGLTTKNTVITCLNITKFCNFSTECSYWVCGMLEVNNY